MAVPADDLLSSLVGHRDQLAILEASPINRIRFLHMSSVFNFLLSNVLGEERHLWRLELIHIKFIDELANLFRLSRRE